MAGIRRHPTPLLLAPSRACSGALHSPVTKRLKSTSSGIAPSVANRCETPETSRASSGLAVSWIPLLGPSTGRASSGLELSR